MKNVLQSATNSAKAAGVLSSPAMRTAQTGKGVQVENIEDKVEPFLGDKIEKRRVKKQTSIIDELEVSLDTSTSVSRYPKKESKVDKFYRTVSYMPFYKCESLDDLLTSMALQIHEINNSESLKFRVYELMKLVNSMGHTAELVPFAKNLDVDMAYAVIKGEGHDSKGAVAEHCTNMVDAVKERLCLELEMNQNIKYDVLLTSNEVRNLGLDGDCVALYSDIDTVDKNKISMTFRDKGIGLNSKQMESTVLTVLNCYKTNSKVTHGTYHKGASGILNFCEAKAILSRRCLSSPDSDGKFAFTILLKTEPMGANSREYWYYLVIDGEVPSFGNKDMNLVFPYGTLGDEFVDGTIMKVYSLKMPCKLGKFFKYTFNNLLPDPQIAFEYMHLPEVYSDDKYCWDGYRRHCVGRRALVDNLVKSKAVIQNGKTRIYLDNYWDKHIARGELYIDVYFTCFSPDYKKAKDIIGSHCISFNLEGQCQSWVTPSIVAQHLNIPGVYRILNYCMWDVSFDNIPSGKVEDMFMSDRNSTRSSFLYEAVEKKLYEFLNGSLALHRLVSEYAYSEVKSSLVNESFDWILKDPDEYKRFCDYARISNGNTMAGFFNDTQNSNNGHSYGVVPRGTKIYSRKSPVLDFDLSHGRSLEFMTGFTYDELADKETNIEVYMDRYDTKKNFEIKGKPSVKLLLSTAYCNKPYPGITLNYNIMSDNTELVNNNTQGTLLINLRADKSNIRPDDTFFIHCKVYNTKLNLYYYATAWLNTIMRTKNPNNPGNKFGRMNKEKLKGALPDSFFVGNISNGDILSYKDVKEKYNINFAKNDVVKVISIGNKLSNIFIDIDSNIFKEAMSKKKCNAIDIGKRVIPYLTSSFYDIYSDKLKEVKNRDNIKSSDIVTLKNKDLEDFVTMVNGLEIQAKNFIRYC